MITITAIFIILENFSFKLLLSGTKLENMHTLSTERQPRTARAGEVVCRAEP
jgi:hypothetical protein